MPFCKKCGAQVFKSFSSCKKCGNAMQNDDDSKQIQETAENKSVKPAAPAVPAAPAATAATVMTTQSGGSFGQGFMPFCNKCGKQVQAGIKFCNNCGNAMQGGNTPQASQSSSQSLNLEDFQTKPAKKSHPWWVYVLCAIAVAIFRFLMRDI